VVRVDLAPNYGRGQSFICSRDIIIIVSTCLPSKNCPHRVRAATFFLFLSWDSFFFAPLRLLVRILSKMLPAIWPAKFAPLRANSQ